ncbi:protein MICRORCHIDIA 2-like [Silene latifolia]|uniref:protein MICRORCHIDIA 2-like n=1 Tax=Silene latifolia TaxID=37657 RepID=UPI003D77176D
MSPSPANNNVVNVIELESSDDEDEASAAATVPQQPSRVPTSSLAITPSDPSLDKLKLDCRSFWQAGNYEIGPSSFVPLQGELEHARVHPKFLHSNATSHKWAFGAIAELLDNAVDEIPNGATFVKVDRIINAKDNSPALLFHDDGGGMNPDGMRKCMSLGYSSKKSNTTIGQYGNGFKTSTMRLGADVIVFSRSTKSGQATQSIGLLSYTYLRLTGQDDVIVPMVDFDISNHWAQPIIYGSQDDWTTNLNTILEWSPFTSKEELLMQFEDIGAHGTKVVVYNLWLNDEGIYELSFDDDEEDIKLRDETSRVSGSKVNKRTIQLESHISYRLRYSLRAYASILYLRKFKNFKILLRGKPIEQHDIAGDLQFPDVVSYKPQLAATSKEVTVKTTIGFIKEAPDLLAVAGFNVYHKNRLIRPFWKVTRDGNSVGCGVVGVLEANFIEPAHDKQDFERSPLFIRLEGRMKQMVMDYWKSNCHRVGYKPYNVRGDNHPAGPPKTQKISPVVQRSNRVSPTEAHLTPVILSTQSRGNHQEDQPYVQPIIELSADDLGDDSTALSVEQICEENIKLFTRCEEHVQKEQQLKQTVSKLQKELDETRKKCAQLAAYLETRKKQQNLVQ